MKTKSFREEIEDIIDNNYQRETFLGDDSWFDEEEAKNQILKAVVKMVERVMPNRENKVVEFPEWEYGYDKGTYDYLESVKKECEVR